MHRTASTFSQFLAISAILAGLATGCASKGGAAKPRSTGTTRVTAPSESRFPVVHEDWAKLGYRLDWVGFPFGVSDSRVPVVALSLQDEYVVIQRNTSAVTLMEATTGRNRWSTELTGPLTKWVGIVRDDENAGRLLVVSESELFMLAPATGNLLARHRLGRVVNTPPLLVGNAAVFGTSLGVVHCHNLVNGLPLWAFASNSSIDARLLDVGGAIAAVSQGGDVMFFNGQGSMVGRAEVYGPLDCDPGTDGNLLFVASRDQSLWAFHTTGGTAWRYRTSNPLKGTPVAHDGTLYADLGTQGITALDPNSGSIKWSSPNAHGTVIGMRDGRLLAWDGSSLATLNPATGDIIEKAAMPGIVTVASDAFVDGNVYAVSDRGVVAKFMVR